ncbi:MAG: inosine/xanthosine triphosphatase [Nanoarchaeota archaeon]
MIICVGSTNQVKISAVSETLKHYPGLQDATVTGIATESGVSDQPLSLTETITGAKNRAKAAFSHCDYSIGLESGLIKVPEAKTGYLDLCVCALYNGKDYAIGFSPALEYPRSVIKLILEKGMDTNQACHTLGITTNPKLGSAEGLYGILTKGRMNRKEYTKYAVMMALIQIEHKELYR